MKKYTSFLSLLILLFLLVSCTSRTHSNQEETTSPDKKTDETALPVYEDSVFDDFGGREIKILSENVGLVSEFDYTTDANGEWLNERIYKRNRTVENKLHCILSSSYVIPSALDSQKYIKLAESGDYMIYAAGETNSAFLALKGMTEELLSLNDNVLDLEKPWWPENIENDLSFDGKLYFVTGDISLNHTSSLGVLYYNKNIVNGAGIVHNDLYELSMSDSWSLEEFYKLSHRCKKNENGIVTFGLVLGAYTEYADAFFQSSGFSILNTENGMTVLSIPDDELTRANDCFVDVCSFFSDECTSVSWKDSEDGIKLFDKGQGAFTTAALSHASVLKGINFGILPMPKYSESDEYRTPLYSGSTFYSIADIMLEDVNMCGKILSSLGSNSANLIMADYADKIIGVIPETREQNMRVFEKIKSEVYFDVLGGYIPALGDGYSGVPASASRVFRNGVLSYSQSVTPLAYQRALESCFEKYKAAIDDIRGLLK